MVLSPPIYVAPYKGNTFLLQVSCHRLVDISNFKCNVSYNYIIEHFEDEWEIRIALITKKVSFLA